LTSSLAITVLTEHISSYGQILNNSQFLFICIRNFIVD